MVTHKVPEAHFHYVPGCSVFDPALARGNDRQFLEFMNRCVKHGRPQCREERLATLATEVTQEGGRKQARLDEPGIWLSPSVAVLTVAQPSSRKTMHSSPVDSEMSTRTSPETAARPLLKVLEP